MYCTGTYRNTVPVPTVQCTSRTRLKLCIYIQVMVLPKNLTKFSHHLVHSDVRFADLVQTGIGFDPDPLNEILYSNSI